MFSKIFLDHILNLRIHQLSDFFDFPGFTSNLNPSLHGVGKINSPQEKNLTRKKKHITRFLKISD